MMMMRKNLLAGACMISNLSYYFYMSYLFLNHKILNHLLQTCLATQEMRLALRTTAAGGDTRL